jgi:hypothetical protein
MYASFNDRRFHVAMLFLLTAAACGGRSDDGADGGMSSTGGSAGTGSGGVSGGSTGGNGGVSGTGGAGAGGNAGAGGTGGVITGDSGTCGCTTRHVGWGMNGGHVTYHDSSALEICNLFLHQRMPVSQGIPAMSCEQQFTNCTSTIGPGEVTRAIANSDVQAAIAAAPILYGDDPRPADGQVLGIQIGSASIEVGGACKAPGCKPAPAGVSALADLLMAMTKQELSRSPCNAVFPPAP